jgi:hypothetical protein
MNIFRFLVSENYREKYSKDFCERLDWEMEQQEVAYKDINNNKLE